MPNIIIADQSYKLSELAAATTNADTDIFYVVKIVDGEEVAYKITREQLLSGLAGTLGIENDGTAVGNADTLNFVPGANITFTITDAGSGQINVGIAASGSVSVAWGSIIGILSDQTDLQTALDGKLSSIVAGTNVTVDNTDPQNPIVSATDTGEVNTASNVGTGDGVFKQKTGVDLEFKTLVAGTNITLNDSADEIEIVASGGTGDVVGPASATDNAIPRYNNTTGKIIQNSGVTIDDSDNVSGANEVEAASYSNAAVVTLTDTSGLDFSLADSNFFEYTLTANETLNLPTNLRVCNFQIKFVQDGTGSRTLSFDAGYLFAGGTAPTLSTAANSVDIITGFCDGTDIYIVANLDFQTA